LKKKKKKCEVLEEEVYVEKMSEIVERDYFPSLKKLREDVEETESRVDPEEDTDGDNESNSNLTLDKFVAKYTSEDNASFEEMIEDAKIRDLKKLPRLGMVKDEEEGKRQLEQLMILPSIQKQVEGSERPTAPLTWPFQNINHLMYLPEGAELTAQEASVLSRKPQVIKENTRFKKDPFDATLNEKAIKEASLAQAQMQEGKIRADGTVVKAPVISGYSMIPMTPTHVPSTPLMTWGEIDSTPQRLDPPTPSRYLATPETPRFRLPDVPIREALGHSLSERVAQRTRDKKRKALEGLAKPTKTGSGASALDRLSSMSPAAQRLAATKLGITAKTDTKLQESYTPRTSIDQSTPFLKSPLPSDSRNMSKRSKK
jgi:protein DGCR14